jgi:hypothetical protein
LSGNEARPQFQPDSLIRLLNLRSLWVDLLDINAGAAQVAEARGAALAIAEAPATPASSPSGFSQAQTGKS